jgi:hypothetical protein
VRLWDPATGAAVRTLEGHGNRVTSVAFSPDGRLLASASRDNTVRLWDPATGAAVRTLEGHGASVTSVAFSPDGRLLASASGDNTVRLWDPSDGRPVLFSFGGRCGTWAACRFAEGRCWRYDDGNLLWEPNGRNGLVPLPLPAPPEPARLALSWLPAAPDPDRLSPGDGEAQPFVLQVENQGPSDAYWLRIGQEPNASSPFLLYPPESLVRLAPGESAVIGTAVSFAADREKPVGTDGTLRLRLTQAHGEPIPLEVPVHGRAPELALAGEPEKIKGDVPTLALRVRNDGEQELKEAEFRARVSGIERPLDRVTVDLIPDGEEVALSFALPKGTELTEDSRLTLEARELSLPPHQWVFPDLSIRLPTPPWQLYAGLAALVTALGVLLWYLRQYTHPLTRRLATEPAALPSLGLEELAKARALLGRTRRLGSVLAASGVHARWLDQAIRFRTGSPEDQVEWLAHRLGAGWQRLDGLGADGAVERFELTLGEDFPLNLKTCSVVFPPADWPEGDVLTSLAASGDQVCLILSHDLQQRTELSRRCRTPENWWVAPEDGELSALLLSPEPVEAFARLIAGYVKVARISPYQTRAGVSKETAFFGRTQIISDIQHREPANYLLVGGRQLGKSSLLLALKRRYDGDAGVECSYLSVGRASIESRLARALGMPSGSSLEAVLERLGEPESGRRRLLLIDEADVFVEQDAGRGYACLNGFRSLSDEGRCQFVLAGFWSLYRSASFDYHSPIKNFAETITIGALEPDACRDLVTRPMAALNLGFASEAMVQRILDLTGGRANLIAIVCDQMLKGLGLEQRELTEADLERALESRSLRSALEGWANLTGDEESDRLDRLIVYGLIERDAFGLGEVLDCLKGLGYDTEPERVKESLTRLELAFIVGRSREQLRWQVPLWRGQVLAEEPERMLEREMEVWRAGRP